MTDEDDRVKCWALGARTHQLADELLEAGDAAREQSPTRMGVQVNPPEEQSAINSTNRARILYWAREFDSVLTRSASCGVEANGNLGGEFGCLQDWERETDLEALAGMAQRVALAVSRGVGQELEGEAPVGDDTPDGVYAFLDAEEYWNSLTADQRAELLREVGDDPGNYVGADGKPDVGTRPYGTLSPDTLDALEGIAMSKREKAGS